MKLMKTERTTVDADAGDNCVHAEGSDNNYMMRLTTEIMQMTQQNNAMDMVLDIIITSQ